MPLDEFLSSIIVWLREEDFIRDQGAAPGDMVSLSGKSLLALNKTLRGSIVSVGQRLSEAARMGTWCWDDLGGSGRAFRRLDQEYEQRLQAQIRSLPRGIQGNQLRP